MAEEAPSLHVDTDWKKQAQEEKRKLAEEAAKKQAAAGAAAPSVTASPGTGRAGGRERARGEVPPANFATLVQSIVTQILFYLGEIAVRGQESAINLDMAKHHIDILGLLEQKTANNLTEDEKLLLDTALYETRMRYVNVASQFA